MSYDRIKILCCFLSFQCSTSNKIRVKCSAHPISLASNNFPLHENFGVRLTESNLSFQYFYFRELPLTAYPFGNHLAFKKPIKIRSPPSMFDHATAHIVGGTMGLPYIQITSAFTTCPFVPCQSVVLHSASKSSLTSRTQRLLRGWRLAYRPRSRNVVHACEQAPKSAEDSTSIAASRRRSLQKARVYAKLPTLFQKPEAVLGIVLAAAALLTDFARNLVRLSMRSQPTRPALFAELNDVESSIASLQEALDVSKETLADTERNLDVTLSRASTAESAIASMDDTRATLASARQQASDVNDRLTNARAALRSQAESRSNARADANTLRDERDRLVLTVTQREKELNELRLQLNNIRSKDNSTSDVGASPSGNNDLLLREKKLLEEIQTRDEQLKTTLQERNEVEEKAKAAAARVDALEGEAEEASRALQETQMELDRLNREAAAREQELVRMEQESSELARRSKESDRLRDVLANMERELGALQEELRSRDRVVENAAREFDALKGFLAARDAEIRQLEARLASAISIERDRGGDPRQSDHNLQEVTDSLEAEQLALSAEIAQAKLTGLDLSGEEFNELDNVSEQIDAEEKLLEANLRRAELKLRRQQQEQDRKENAVHDIMESVEDESLQQNAAMQWPPVYPNKVQLNSGEVADDFGQDDDSASANIDVDGNTKDRNLADLDSSNDDSEKELKSTSESGSNRKENETDIPLPPVEGEEWEAEDDALYKKIQSSDDLNVDDQYSTVDLESDEIMKEFYENMNEKIVSDDEWKKTEEEVLANMGYSIENAGKDETDLSKYSDEQLRSLLFNTFSNESDDENWTSDLAKENQYKDGIAGQEDVMEGKSLTEKDNKNASQTRKKASKTGEQIEAKQNADRSNDDDPNRPKRKRGRPKKIKT